jgi:hypothetical protein
MPWLQPLPKDTSTDREKGNFSREVWTRVKFDTFPFAPVAIPAATSATYTISTTAGDVVTEAVRFLRIGMGVKVTWPAKPSAGLTIDGECLANDELKVQIQNFTGGALVPPPGNYIFWGVVL